MAIDIGGGGLGAVYLGDTLIAGGGGGGSPYGEGHCLISAGRNFSICSGASFCLDGYNKTLCGYRFLLFGFKHQNYHCTFAGGTVLDSNKCIYYIPWINHCGYYNCAGLYSYNGDTRVGYTSRPYSGSTACYYNVTSTTTGKNIQGTGNALTKICADSFSFMKNCYSGNCCIRDGTNAATCIRRTCNSPCVAVGGCSRTSNY